MAIANPARRGQTTSNNKQQENNTRKKQEARRIKNLRAGWPATNAAIISIKRNGLIGKGGIAP
jgi:hypothetical protein